MQAVHTEKVRKLKGRELDKYFLENAKDLFAFAEQTPQNQVVDFFNLNKPQTNDFIQNYMRKHTDTVMLYNAHACTCGGEIVEGMCKQCCQITGVLVDLDNGGEPPPETTVFSYKQLSHFKEILQQIQGKESTLIPQEILDKITNQLTKERLSLEALTYIKCKLILKKLNLKAYYDHVNKIRQCLGLEIPYFDKLFESILCNQFLLLLPSFAKIRSPNRKNFCNYLFILANLCRFHNRPLQGMPLLKDEKLTEHEKIWMHLVKELEI